jgi:hypothetical protein
MVRDQLVRRALEDTNWDLMACSMPSNVLLMTGYWPAAGYSLAVATRNGQILLIVPEDEDDVAELSWADDVRMYRPVALDRLMTAEEPVYESFAKLKGELGLVADRAGFEQAESFEPAGIRAESLSRQRRPDPQAGVPRRDARAGRRVAGQPAKREDRSGDRTLRTVAGWLSRRSGKARTAFARARASPRSRRSFVPR